MDHTESCDPLMALQRDDLYSPSDESTAVYKTHLSNVASVEQLDELITTQRKLQNVLKDNYLKMVDKYQILLNQYHTLCSQNNLQVTAKLMNENKWLKEQYFKQKRSQCTLQDNVHQRIAENRNPAYGTQNYLLQRENQTLRLQLADAERKIAELECWIKTGQGVPPLPSESGKITITSCNNSKNTESNLKIDVVAQWHPVFYLSEGGQNHQLCLGDLTINTKTTWVELEQRAFSVMDLALKSIFLLYSPTGLERTVHQASNCTAENGSPGEPGSKDLQAEIMFLQLGRVFWSAGHPPKFDLGTSLLPMDRLRSVVEQQQQRQQPLLPATETGHTKRPAVFTAEPNLVIDADCAVRTNELALHLGPLLGGALECCIDRHYLDAYLQTLDKHTGLLFLSSTSVAWIRCLLHTLARLLFLKLKQTIPERVPLHCFTLRLVDIRDCKQTFRFSDWLTDQGFPSSHDGLQVGRGDGKECSHSRVVILLLETMEFLHDPMNYRDFQRLLGQVRNESIRLYLLGCTDRLIAPLQDRSTLKFEEYWVSLPTLQVGRYRFIFSVHHLQPHLAPLVGVVPYRTRIYRYIDRRVNRSAAVTENFNDFFLWIESIWLRLVHILDWIGLLQVCSRTVPQWLSQLTNSSGHPLLSRFSVIHWPRKLRTSEHSQLAEYLRSTVQTLTDLDVFLTCPGLNFHHEKFNRSSILHWLTDVWNRLLEPGLQMCTSLLIGDGEAKPKNGVPAGESPESGGTIGESEDGAGGARAGVAPDDLKLIALNDEDGEVEDDEYNLLKDAKPGSRGGAAMSSESAEEAAELFIKQILLPKCPLMHIELQYFLINLNGGRLLLMNMPIDKKNVQPRRRVTRRPVDRPLKVDLIQGPSAIRPTTLIQTPTARLAHHPRSSRLKLRRFPAIKHHKQTGPNSSSGLAISASGRVSTRSPRRNDSGTLVPANGTTTHSSSIRIPVHHMGNSRSVRSNCKPPTKVILLSWSSNESLDKPKNGEEISAMVNGDKRSANSPGHQRVKVKRTKSLPTERAPAIAQAVANTNVAGGLRSGTSRSEESSSITSHNTTESGSSSSISSSNSKKEARY